MSEITKPIVAIASFSLGVAALRFLQNALNAVGSSSDSVKYSLPDQPQRFANDKKANNIRVMNIDAIYDPSFVVGKNVLVTGEQPVLVLFINTIDQFRIQGEIEESDWQLRKNLLRKVPMFLLQQEPRLP
jgi:hypothetical protein